MQRQIGIKRIFCDIDGTLTPGEMYRDPDDGEVKGLKVFSGRDCEAIHQFLKRGISVKFITRSQTNKEDVLAFAQKSGMDPDKDVLFLTADESIEMLKAEAEKGKFWLLGDSLLDAEAMTFCNVYGACPADACLHTRHAASYITDAVGGKGVLMELFCSLFPLKDIMEYGEENGRCMHKR